MAISLSLLTALTFFLGVGSASSVGGNLRLQPPDGREIRLGGTGDTLGVLDLTATDLGAIASGFRSLAIGNSNSQIAIVAPTTFSSPLTLQGSSIAIENPLRAIDSATITLNAPQTALNANIETSGGDITFTGNLSLGADIALSTQAYGSILLPGTIDGTHQLRLDGQRVVFGDTVGLVAPLASLTVNGGSMVRLRTRLP